MQIKIGDKVIYIDLFDKRRTGVVVGTRNQDFLIKPFDEYGNTHPDIIQDAVSKSMIVKVICRFMCKDKFLFINNCTKDRL